MPVRRLRGFTLVELLVTTALVSLVGATVVAAVSGCLRVWSKVNSHGEATAWTELAFEGMRRDLHNLKSFSPLVFDGSYDAMAFPALVHSSLSNGEAIAEIGQVGYYFDSQRKRLCRAEEPYRMLRRVRLKERCHSILSDVSGVHFSYYSPKSETSEAGWSSRWEAEGLPAAVKIEVQYDRRMVGKKAPDMLLVHLPLAMAKAR